MKLKTAFKICLMLCICLIMAGCGSQSYTITINDDDSVKLVIRCTVDTSTYKLLSSYSVNIDALNRQKITNSGTGLDNVEAVFQENAAVFESYGFTINAVDDSIEVGFEAEKTYQTIEAANTDIETLYKAHLTGLNVVITKEEGYYKTQYKVYGTLKYYLDPDIDLEDPDTLSNFNRIYDKSKLTASLSVLAPSFTQISASDGTSSASGAGVTWTAIYENGNKEVNTHVIAEQPHTKAYVVTIIIVVLFGSIVFSIGKRAYIRLREKKQQASQESFSSFEDLMLDEEIYTDDEDSDEET